VGKKGKLLVSHAHCHKKSEIDHSRPSSFRFFSLLSVKLPAYCRVFLHQKTMTPVRVSWQKARSHYQYSRLGPSLVSRVSSNLSDVGMNELSRVPIQIFSLSLTTSPFYGNRW
jgi:hypothetical protein